MDPVTIIATATTALKTLYAVSTAVFSFVDGTLGIDSAIQSFLDEIDSLKNAIIAIQSCLHSPPLGRNRDDRLQELFTLVAGTLSNCKASLKELERILAKIMGDHSDHNPLYQPVMKIKLDLNANDVVKHRRQIVTHTTSIQVILTSINLHVSTQGPDIVISTLVPKIDILVDMLLSMNQFANDRGSNEILDINSLRAAEDTSRVKVAAQKVISSARSVVISNSTVWGGSVVSYQDLGREQQERISKWNLDTVDEIISSSTENEDGKLNFDSDNEDALQLEVFANIMKEGQFYFEEGKFGKAEGFYLQALKTVDGIPLPTEHALLHNEIYLKLAKIYIQEKKFDKAKGVLLQLLAKPTLDLPAAEAEQLVEGTHRIAEVHFYQNELEDAEKCCRRVITARRRTQGRNSPEFIESVTLLVAIYEASGNTELATGYRSLVPGPGSGRVVSVAFGKKKDIGTTSKEAGFSSQSNIVIPQDRWQQGPAKLSAIYNSQTALPLRNHVESDKGIPTKQQPFKFIQKLEGFRMRSREEILHHTIAFSSDGHRLATSGERTIRIWELGKKGKFELVFEYSTLKESVFSLAFSPCGRLVMTASRNQEIRILEVDERGYLRHVQVVHALDEIFSVTFSQEGEKFAYSYCGGNIRLWVVNGQSKLELVREFKGFGEVMPRYYPYKVTVSSDGRITAANDRDVQIFETNKQDKVKLAQKLEGHTKDVRSVAFDLSRGRLLASATDTREGRIRIWAADEQGKFEQVQELKSHRSITRAVFGGFARYQALAFSHDGRWLASSLMFSETIFIWGRKE